MMEIKKTAGRALSFLLASCMTLSTGMTSFAQAGTALCDEALYVTLDPYGEAKESSVVKSYQLNGAKQIVDYGAYSEIINMTDYVTPVEESGKFTFNLGEERESNRFYFEGKTDPEKAKETIPWNLTVSYKLNGVERRIEELSHEKGLVEIHIDAVPNKRTGEYFRNNMTLAAAAIVDMDKNLSVEAPGAQVQSVGSMKTVIFMALPGEEQHFELRIGSDDFEFSGMMFMMMPVTLGQLDRLDELRDARDTVKASADAIGDSLDVVLDSLSGLSDGLSGTAKGLKKLDESRRIIADAKDGIYVSADGALAVLKELSDRGVPFTSYVTDAQNALTDANRDINQTADTVNELSDHLDNLHWGLRNVSRDLNDVSELLEEGSIDMGRWNDKLNQLRRDLEDLKKFRQLVNRKLEELRRILGRLRQLKQDLAEHKEVLGISGENYKELIGILEELTGEAPEELLALIASNSNAIRQGIGDPAWNSLIPGDPNLLKIAEWLDGLIGEIENMSALDDMITSVQSAISSMEEVIGRVADGGESMENVLADTGDLADSLRRAAGTGTNLINDLNRATETLNRYHGTAKDALRDAGLLIGSAVRGTDAMYVLMKDVEENLRAAGAPLNEGTKATIGGLTEALDKAIEGLSKTDTIRDAKTTAEDLIDDKWEEYAGGDMTLLNIDSEAPKVSFTSAQNPEPQSMQIILRTEGTDEAEDEAAVEVDESFHAKGTFFQRIVSVFKKIVDAVRSIFG